jgi:hypothetical protein
VEEIKSIKICNQALKEWEDRYIPNYDFFYFENPEHAKSLLQSKGLIFPRDELASNSQLNTLDNLTTFTPWKVDKKAKYVAVINNEEFSKLDNKNRKEIFYLQWKLGRGQIWDLEVLEQFQDHPPFVLDDYSFLTEEGEKVIIQKPLWIQLSTKFKERLLKYIANLFIDEDKILINLSEIKEHFPLLEPYINSFSSKNGPNCFASVLGALEKNESTRNWIINQWVQPKTFFLNLDIQGYKEIARITDSDQLTVKSTDVIVWLSSDEIPVHTCFVLNNKTVFNKNGQMMFNPW